MVKLSEKEKAAHKAAFQAMNPAEKAEHIFTYHKWSILLVLLVLLILGSIIHRQLTQKKPVLYLAVINASFGENVEKSLTEDFLAAAGFDARRQEVYLYRDLYLSENADTLNHEYAYASKVKLSGAISAEKLDLVLMNREALPFGRILPVSYGERGHPLRQFRGLSSGKCGGRAVRHRNGPQFACCFFSSAVS